MISFRRHFDVESLLRLLVINKRNKINKKFFHLTVDWNILQRKNDQLIIVPAFQASMCNQVEIKLALELSLFWTKNHEINFKSIAILLILKTSII